MVMKAWSFLLSTVFFVKNKKSIKYFLTESIS